MIITIAHHVPPLHSSSVAIPDHDEHFVHSLQPAIVDMDLVLSAIHTSTVLTHHLAILNQKQKLLLVSVVTIAVTASRWDESFVWRSSR